MTLEAKIDRTNELLGQLLTAFQSGQQVAAPTAPAEPAKKTRKSSKDEPAASTTPVVDGDPEGTRYWVSEEHKQVFAQTPGAPDPKDQSFKIETADQYLAKKAEFAAAGNEKTADAVQASAGSEPSATAQAGTASAEISWKDDVFPAIKALNDAKKAEGIRTLIEHFGLSPKSETNPNGATVPALEKLGRHAEVKAAAEKLTRGESLKATDADDLGI